MPVVDCYAIPMFSSALRAGGARRFHTQPPLRFLFGWFTARRAPIVHPPDVCATGNRIYPAIRTADELGPYLLDHDPLVLNFTVRGDVKCNEVTQPLYDHVASSTPKRINVVDVETDEIGTRELMQRYLVLNVPELVVLHNQIVVARWTPSATVNVADLKTFVDVNGV